MYYLTLAILMHVIAVGPNVRLDQNGLNDFDMNDDFPVKLNDFKNIKCVKENHFKICIGKINEKMRAKFEERRLNLNGDDSITERDTV